MILVKPYQTLAETQLLIILDALNLVPHHFQFVAMKYTPSFPKITPQLL